MRIFVNCFVGLLLVTPAILLPAISEIKDAIPELPSPTEFLCWLFNATAEEIPKIVEKFKFHDIPLEDIQFLHYKKPASKGDIANETIQIKPEDLDLTIPTKIIVHGWRSEGTADFVVEMASSYYNKTDNLNVVAVNWSNHSTLIYLIASGSTRGVGNHLGDFIVNATKSNSNLLKNVHIIGHSLGAHISGFAGERVANKTGKKINRISALDAASPLFEFPSQLPEYKRISKRDAHFVDSIHTNVGFLGQRDTFANADFYVENGGPIQPGCLSINIFDALICSHSKSQKYFSETITNKTYEGFTCPIAKDVPLCKSDDKVVMGDPVSKSTSGKFYVSTQLIPLVPLPEIPVPDVSDIPVPNIPRPQVPKLF